MTLCDPTRVKCAPRRLQVALSFLGSPGFTVIDISFMSHKVTRVFSGYDGDGGQRLHLSQIPIYVNTLFFLQNNH